MPSKRGYEALRLKRVSIPGATYFVTICTHDRAAGLNEPTVSSRIRGELLALQTDKVLTLHAAVIMPDHLHLLFTSSGELAVGQTIARLKFKTKFALTNCDVRWQGNYYEHRMRPSESMEEVLRYILLNPYRAGLLSADATYPHFWVGDEEARWFRSTLDDDRPFPEWLK